MKGTEKQITWATDLLHKFQGTTQSDLVAAFRAAGQEKVVGAGITGPQDIAGFAKRCDEYVRAADAAWIINSYPSLGICAARDLLNQ